ncbi:MAG: cytochrome c [Thiobacillus sp.]|nr:cytochrome c [Thiobacillus sp.]
MLKSTFSKTSLFSPALFLILVLGGGAHAETPVTTPGDPAQFARGAKAWANNCASCHNLRPASDLRDDQWRVVVAHMRIRADLTGQEARDVLKFLQESN